MDDTTQKVETATPATLSNEPSTSGTPVATPPVKTDDGEIEKLRKEAAQAKLREKQLANELEAARAAKAAEQAKELEEQNKFKELYEQEKARNEGLASEIQEKEQKAEIAKAKKAVLSEYDAEVATTAEELGIDLADSSDTAVADFKEKVDKINTKVVSTSKVAGNNQPQANAQPKLSNEELREALRTDKGFHDIVSRMPGVATMIGKN